MWEMGAYGIYSNSTNETTSQTDFDVNANYLSMGLYLKNWWAFSVGMLPFSYVNYEINSSDMIGGELISYDKHYTGTGGLNRVNFGNSFRIFKGLAVGFNASYIFGHIKQTETAMATDSFSGYEFTNNCFAYGSYFDYGLQYSIDTDDWRTTIGFIYGAGKTLDTKDDLEFVYNGAVSTFEDEDQSTVEVPQKFGVGFSVKKGDNFKAGFDYKLNEWSNIDFTNGNLNANNSNRYSVGVEYSAVQKSEKRQSWLKKLRYRLGATYKNSYLEIDKTPINTMGVNLGLGIPFNRANMLNVSIEYGEEGTLDKSLIKNRYVGMYLSFSLYQFWAKRRGY